MTYEDSPAARLVVELLQASARPALLQPLPERLWIGPNGEVCCEKHAGVMLSTSIEANPEGLWQHGYGGTWLLATVRDRLMFEATGYVFACETCSPVMQRPKVGD